MPLCASSNRPSFPPRLAPVKEPSSYPKSSLSSRLSGSAAQFTATNGPVRRGLSLWMLWAMSSFPTPLSPPISTARSDLAKRVARSMIEPISGLPYTMCLNSVRARKPFLYWERRISSVAV
ncbi:MAG: hypothetical protein BWY85_01047 [Firmicutes bacterium ADurb.Bin506]|nr:MAG: hypothetical protein BWY85_01047 [Firmicutes bacterium ADurb.Bin506]